MTHFDSTKDLTIMIKSKATDKHRHGCYIIRTLLATLDISDNQSRQQSPDDIATMAMFVHLSASWFVSELSSKLKAK